MTPDKKKKKRSDSNFTVTVSFSPIFLMDKKILLFTLLALMTGTLLGYTGKSLKRDSKTVSPALSADHAGVRPRFGDTLSSHSLSPSSSTRSKKTEGATKIDQELKRFSLMNHEELWEELEKFKKQSLNFDYSKGAEINTLLFCICSRLGQESPRQTLQKMEKFDDHNDNFLHCIINAWANKNPDAVLSYCRENMGEDTKKNGLLSDFYIFTLSKQSPDKALDYLTTLSPEKQSNYLYYPLSGLSDKMPEKMAEAVAKLAPALQESDWLHAQIASLWAQKDWEAASQWINTLPEKQRMEALGNALMNIPLEESSKKLAALMKQEKEEAMKHISGNLFYESTQKAVEWLTSHATKEEAAKAIDNANYYHSSFLSSDNIAYVNQMPSGALKDSLLAKMVKRIYPNDQSFIFLDRKMEDHLSMADKISDQTKREKSLDYALNSWMYKAPENTRSWLEKSNIPAEKKSAYLKTCDERIKSQNQTE